MAGDTRRIIAHRDANLAIVGWTLPGGDPVQPGGADDADALQAYIRFDRQSEVQDLVWAAQRWLEAVALIDAAVRRADPDTVFPNPFGNLTAAQLGVEIPRTDIEIVNEVEFGNRGVGAAQRGNNGARNKDVLGRGGVEGYYRATGDNRGVVAQALHEFAHLTKPGFAFFDRSVGLHRTYARKRSPGLNFYAGRFAENLECYANDLMLAFAEGLNIDLGRVIPGGARLGEGPRNAKDPDQIFAELMGS
jgi:hypothetical protein